MHNRQAPAGRARAAPQPGAAHHRRARPGVGGDAAAVPAVGLLRGARRAHRLASAGWPAARVVERSHRLRRGGELSMTAGPVVPADRRTRGGSAQRDRRAGRARCARPATFPPLLGERGVRDRRADGAGRRARSIRRSLLYTFRHASGFRDPRRHVDARASSAAGVSARRRAPIACDVRGDYYQPPSSRSRGRRRRTRRAIPLARRSARHIWSCCPAAAYPLPDVHDEPVPARADDHPRHALHRRRRADRRRAASRSLNLPAFLAPPELPPLGAWPFSHGERARRATGRWCCRAGATSTTPPRSLPVANPPTPPLTAAVTMRVLRAGGVTDVPLTVEFGREYSLRQHRAARPGDRSRRPPARRRRRSRRP